MGRKIRYVSIDLFLNSAKPSLEPPTTKSTSPNDYDGSLQSPAPRFPIHPTSDSPKAEESSACAHDNLDRACEGCEKATSSLEVGVLGGPIERAFSPRRDEASSLPQQHNKQAARCMPTTPLLIPRPSPLLIEYVDSHSASDTTQATLKAATFDLNHRNMQYHPLPRRPPPLSQHHTVIASDSHRAFGPATPFTLPARPPHGENTYVRRPIRHAPVIGKVYYMPDGKFFPTSIVHAQKRQDGFFRHPILVIGVEEHTVYFYALTKAVPVAIGELNMCLRMGKTTADEGPGTLKLAHGCPALKTESWVNLEQRFHIEWHNLDEWAIDVRVDIEDLWKLWKRTQELEAEQNRYIYKPLPRDMSLLSPGTVVMLCNNCTSGTLGAPVVILENRYPLFRFLRIKLFNDNRHFNTAAKRQHCNPKHMCLEVSKHPHMGHDGTPVMLLEPDSPEMREPSYLEAQVRPQLGSLEMCKTWCWPPVMVRPQSLQVLWDYVSRLSAPAPGMGVPYPNILFDPYGQSCMHP